MTCFPPVCDPSFSQNTPFFFFLVDRRIPSVTFQSFFGALVSFFSPSFARCARQAAQLAPSLVGLPLPTITGLHFRFIPLLPELFLLIRFLFCALPSTGVRQPPALHLVDSCGLKFVGWALSLPVDLVISSLAGLPPRPPFAFQSFQLHRLFFSIFSSCFCF